jgi:hypothetical protein
MRYVVLFGRCYKTYGAKRLLCKNLWVVANPSAVVWMRLHSSGNLLLITYKRRAWEVMIQGSIIFVLLQVKISTHRPIHGFGIKLYNGAQIELLLVIVMLNLTPTFIRNLVGAVISIPDGSTFDQYIRTWELSIQLQNRLRHRQKVIYSLHIVWGRTRKWRRFRSLHSENGLQFVFPLAVIC